MSTFWFNSELFTLNGAPLKFYLDGFRQSDTQGMTQIIEAFGGKSSNPDVPDTFVFCELDRPVGAEKYDRYNIQYFYDSIVARHPQDLINYKLHISTIQQSWSVVDDHDVIRLISKETNNNNPEKSSNYKLLVTVDRRHVNPVDDDQLGKSYCNAETNNYHRENSIDVSSSAKNQNKSSESGASWTEVNSRETTCFVVVDRLNEDLSQVLIQKQQFNSQNNDNSEEIEKDKCESYFENDGESVESDPLQSNHDCDYIPPESPDASDASVVPNYRGSLSGKRKRMGRKTILFTKKENQKILEWIMKRKVIPSDFAINIWVNMINEKVLKHRKVLPKILAQHFREKLKITPIFKKYIKDSRAMRASRRIKLESSRENDKRHFPLEIFSATKKVS